MNNKIRFVPVILFVAGAAMMLAGFYRGELPVIFNKAATICLECIGIG